ncbi:MAG: hypothetical protein ACI8RE_002588, partial [Ilumatobacter sp.]
MTIHDAQRSSSGAQTDAAPDDRRYQRYGQPTEHDHAGQTWRHDWHEVAGRLLTHLDDGTTDSLPDVLTVSVDDYLDPERWQREVDVLFRS